MTQNRVEQSRYLDPDFLSGLASMELRARSMVEGFLVGLHKSPYHGYNVEFSEHRPYIPGDDIRTLDWKVWAKSDKLYIKRFEAETNMTGHILLDVSASMEYGKPGISKLEYGACLAAGLAYLMVRQKDAAGLVLFREGVERIFPPKATYGNLAQVCAALEQVQGQGTTDIGAVLHELAENIRRRGMIVLISDLHDDPDSIISGLKHFRHRHHDVILFHVLHADEVVFPFNGPTMFVDMETAGRLKTEPTAIAVEYKKRIQALRGDIARQCALAGVDFCPVDTSTPFSKSLAAFLSRRRIASR